VKYSPSTNGSKETPDQTDLLKRNRVPELKYLHAISNGDPVFVREMISTIKESIPVSIAEIKEASHNNDWPTVAKVLHKISPSLSMMDLDQVKAEAALLIEDIKKKRNRKSIPKQVESLCKTILGAIKAL
jgi:HPt (histidine-containing phosphotransfer) domain-containing protein